MIRFTLPLLFHEEISRGTQFAIRRVGPTTSQEVAEIFPALRNTGPPVVVTSSFTDLAVGLYQATESQTREETMMKCVLGQPYNVRAVSFRTLASDNPAPWIS
jgi:hypothetical protein